MKRRFFTLDVFTAQRFAGNPLAVVLDGEKLTDAAMQAVAREFNLSETVFVMPPADALRRADVRIFTPARELPFAGHPTAGTAVLLGILDAAGKPATSQFMLGEKVGDVPCTVTIAGDDSGHAVFALPKLPERLAADYNPAAIASAFGCKVAEIGFADHQPALFSAGVPFPMVPVRSRAVLNNLPVPDARSFAHAFGPGSGGYGFFYCREPDHVAHHFHARMFAPGMGVAEDPATGAAVASLAGAIMAFEKPAEGEHRFVIEQGYAMGRPSQIELVLDVRHGALHRARIGGSAVVVSEGTLSA
ncbi:MAG: PhzF family phenazine biosynthesis protein [Beijerinckiaceae bacterium]